MEAVAHSTQETEVLAKTTRRRFSAAEKKRILELGDACQSPSEIGALLRREGIYSSSYYKWRRAREEKGEAGLSPKKRGPKGAPPNPFAAENAELKRALAKAEARAKRAEALVELQKKISELMGIPLSKSDEES